MDGRGVDVEWNIHLPLFAFVVNTILFATRKFFFTIEPFVNSDMGITVTPAINAAKKANIRFSIHEYQHDCQVESYGNEAVEKLGQNPDQVFKTLVVKLDNKQLAIAVVPVSRQLDLKAFAAACNSKKAAMAEKAEAERATGYIFGGVSPLGQKKRLTTIVDSSAQQFSTIYVSAGRRGLEIELSPSDLIQLTCGQCKLTAK